MGSDRFRPKWQVFPSIPLLAWVYAHGGRGVLWDNRIEPSGKAQ